LNVDIDRVQRFSERLLEERANERVGRVVDGDADLQLDCQRTKRD